MSDPEPVIASRLKSAISSFSEIVHCSNGQISSFVKKSQRLDQWISVMSGSAFVHGFSDPLRMAALAVATLTKSSHWGNCVNRSAMCPTLVNHVLLFVILSME